MPTSANDNKRPDVTAPARPCPICRKEQDAKYRPFCSKHCADVDLARWLGGRYSIEARPELDEDEENLPDSPAGEEER